MKIQSTCFELQIKVGSSLFEMKTEDNFKSMYGLDLRSSRPLSKQGSRYSRDPRRPRYSKNC